jgi:hypothetical protein
MKCKNCGVESVKFSKYCKNCGQEFEKCPVCNMAHEIQAFCPIKGKNISEFIEETRIATRKVEANKKFKEFAKFFNFLHSVSCGTFIILFFVFFAATFVAAFRDLFIWSMIYITLSLTSMVTGIYIKDLHISKFVPKFYKHYKQKFTKKFPDDAKYLE